MDDGTLLLGGSGFLGRALTHRMVREGRPVFVMAPTIPEGDRRGVEYLECRLEDDTVLTDVLPKCATVVYLASATTPGSSRGRPLLELDANLMPTFRFLDRAHRSSIRHLVFLSSGGTVYGNAKAVPTRERDQVMPCSYHGAGKAATEAFLQAFSSETGTPLTILRPSNLYGPGQPYVEGFGIVRTALERVRSNLPFEVWGDGESVRDYLYIDDMVEACMRAICSPVGGIFNVGSGAGYTLNDVLRIVARVSGKSVDICYRDARRTDVKAVVLDVSHIREHLGWQPTVSLEEGVRRTWQWLQQA